MKWGIFNIKKHEEKRKKELRKFMEECPDGFISYVYGLEIEKILNFDRL